MFRPEKQTQRWSITKAVQWNCYETIIPIKHVRDMTKQEIEEKWYSKFDLQSFRAEMQQHNQLLFDKQKSKQSSNNNMNHIFIIGSGNCGHSSNKNGSNSVVPTPPKPTISKIIVSSNNETTDYHQDGVQLNYNVNTGCCNTDIPLQRKHSFFCDRNKCFKGEQFHNQYDKNNVKQAMEQERKPSGSRTWHDDNIEAPAPLYRAVSMRLVATKKECHSNPFELEKEDNRKKCVVSRAA